MGDAKRIKVGVISASQARDVILRYHYSGRYVRNSQLNLGVYYAGRLLGAMQFGPPMDRRALLGLVRGTKWSGMLELNRMALSDELPRNSESRAMAYAFRMLRKHRPDIEWLVSFSDAAQCGDGAIYRSVGFFLTGAKRNKQIVEFPDGHRESRMSLTQATAPMRARTAARYGIKLGNGCSMQPFLDYGARYVDGWQLRYIYFLDPGARARLTVPVLPYSHIDTIGARMYKGKRLESIVTDAAPDQGEKGGAIPTSGLHT